MFISDRREYILTEIGPWNDLFSEESSIKEVELEVPVIIISQFENDTKENISDSRTSPESVEQEVHPIIDVHLNKNFEDVEADFKEDEKSPSYDKDSCTNAKNLMRNKIKIKKKNRVNVGDIFEMLMSRMEANKTELIIYGVGMQVKILKKNSYGPQWWTHSINFNICISG